jgi:hypothetical protein
MICINRLHYFIARIWMVPMVDTIGSTYEDVQRLMEGASMETN